jgi:hypothetical protein
MGEREVGVKFGSEGAKERIVEAARGQGASLRVISDEKGVTSVGDRSVPADAPTWHIEAALLRALEPRHLLFLVWPTPRAVSWPRGWRGRWRPRG